MKKPSTIIHPTECEKYFEAKNRRRKIWKEVWSCICTFLLVVATAIAIVSLVFGTMFLVNTMHRDHVITGQLLQCYNDDRVKIQQSFDEIRNERLLMLNIITNNIQSVQLEIDSLQRQINQLKPKEFVVFSYTNICTTNLIWAYTNTYHRY